MSKGHNTPYGCKSHTTTDRTQQPYNQFFILSIAIFIKIFRAVISQLDPAPYESCNETLQNHHGARTNICVYDYNPTPRPDHAMIHPGGLGWYRFFYPNTIPIHCPPYPTTLPAWLLWDILLQSKAYPGNHRNWPFHDPAAFGPRANDGPPLPWPQKPTPCWTAASPSGRPPTVRPP